VEKKPKEMDIQKHVLGLNGRVIQDLKEKGGGGVVRGVINLGKRGTRA